MKTVQLRDYQLDVVEEADRRLANGIKRLVIYAPTGGGKGEIAVELANRARNAGKRVLFVVHRKDLVQQQWQRFAKYNIYPGVLQGNNTNNPHAPITVASIQTFSSRVKFGWAFEFDYVIIDEAHLCAGSTQYHEFLKSHSNLPVIGLTATPFSKGLGKNMPWGQVFEDMIVQTTIQDLINREYLVDLDIYAPSGPDLSKVQIVAGEYNQKQLGVAVDKSELIGDIVKHWFKLAGGKQTILFATNINHSKHICEQFSAHGIAAEHLDCYSKESTREAVIKKFREGEIKILCNVDLFSEGFDAPETACMILAKPTRSLIKYIQMVGRVLRPAEGKGRALVIDHSGTVHRLGFPTDDLPLFLNDGTKADSVKSERKIKQPKICVSCKAVDKQRRIVCPVCGYKTEVKQKPLDIKEGDLNKIVKMPQSVKQAIWSGLLTYGTRKGYKRGWCAHAYKDLVGVWPKGVIDQCGPIPEAVERHIKYKQIRYAKSRLAR